jgi:hypothetical protein
MALYWFAASVPFKVGSASIAAEAICMAISIESAWGGMLGDLEIEEVGGQNFFLRIAGFYVLVALTQCRFAYWVRAGKPNEYMIERRHRLEK